MSFLDIKNPARRNELVQEYVDDMKTVRKRNLHTREEKLTIGEELNTLFKPVVQATEKAASEKKKEMEELRGALEKNADFAVTRPRKAGARTKYDDKTFGPYWTKTGKLHLGVSEIKQERLPGGVDQLVVGRRRYDMTPGFSALLTQIRPTEYTEDDFKNYTKLIAQTKTVNNPGPNAVANPKSTWKYKNLLKDMGLDMSDDTSTVTSPERQDDDVLFTPTRTSAGSGVGYHPGDMSGLSKKLELLSVEFLAGNTTVRNELVYVLDALLWLKKLTKKEYTEITNRL